MAENRNDRTDEEIVITPAADAPPPGHALPGGPEPRREVVAAEAGPVDDPEEARERIEATRARMSETIDEIEGQLLRRKEEIQDKLGFVEKLRKNPYPSLGAVFLGGLVLGYLTGEGEEIQQVRIVDLEVDADDDLDLEVEARAQEMDERARTWESRARRLMRVAEEQEEEIAELRDRLSRRGRLADFDRYEEMDEEELEEEAAEPEGFMEEMEEGVEELGHFGSALRTAVAELASGAIRNWVSGLKHGAEAVEEGAEGLQHVRRAMT